MDRRLFLSGLLGIGATTTLTSILPRQAQVLAAIPSGEQAPMSEVLPQLDVLPEVETPVVDLDDGIELAWHEGRPHRRRRRRRRRERRWRRQCRRYWDDGRWRRRCRRVPYWIWIWFWI
jgi:hypothetical protein